MLQVARWRIFLVVAVTILGIIFALPNALPERVRENLPPFLPRDTLNLGLDLQGGAHLLLEVDTATLQRQQLDNIADQMGVALREAQPAIRFTGRGVVGEAARVRVDPADIQPRGGRCAIWPARPPRRTTFSPSRTIPTA